MHPRGRTGVRKALLSMVATPIVSIAGCGEPANRLLHDTDHAALVAACRRAMQSLPPAGPPIEPTVYSVDPGDPRFREMFRALEARTVTFQSAADRSSVTDSRLPSEILRLQPLYVAVTPDAVYMSLCGSGLSCSASAARLGAGLEVFRYLKGGEPSCRSLVQGLWYCHE